MPKKRVPSVTTSATLSSCAAIYGGSCEAAAKHAEQKYDVLVA